MIIKERRIVCSGKDVLSSQLAFQVMDLAIERDVEITLFVSGKDEYPTFLELEKFLLNISLLLFVIEQNKPIDN